MDVVGSMPGMVDALPRKLAVLQEQQYALLSGNLADVVFIEDELRYMRAVIEDCESLHEPDAQTTGWVGYARELAYDVEDWVDLLDLRVRSTAPSSRILSWLRHVWHMPPKRRRIVIDIEVRELKQRVLEVSQSHMRTRYHDRLAPLVFPGVPQPVEPRLTTRLVNDGRLVGFDGPIEEVTKMVMDAGCKAKQPKLKIVSIVGMAGSGKTTLAAAVYRQLRQIKYFQLQAFVSVGRKPGTVEHALREMLSELVDGHRDGPIENISQLSSMIRKILENKSYLIVVDDLWSLEDWQSIKSCFPVNSLGSRIITTTRNISVANATNSATEFSSSSRGSIYNIRLLSDADSKRLILSRAFGIGHACPKNLEDDLAQITRRCGGLPLALITVVSMLQHKFAKGEWYRLVQSRWLSCPNAREMMEVLDRIYKNLSPTLRICLLYLSTFPWNEVVDVDRLARRCNAEGYIDPNHVEIYLNELIDINMVAPMFWNKDGMKCCWLHPVIHDFIVCKSTESNFATLLDAQHQDSPSTVHRICLQSSKDLTQEGAIMDLLHARSIFGWANSAPPLTSLRVVRTLDLEGCVGPVCLEGLDKLLLLRYLSLKGTDVSYLPTTIGELRWLEELDVRSTNVKQLPPSIVGLRDTLKTLLFSYEGMTDSVETTTRITKHCRRLENFATIDLREHHESFVKDLGDLNNLRMLEITWSFRQCTEGAYRKSLLSAMAMWRQLRSLTIHCGGVGCCMEFLGSLSHPPELLEKFKVTAGGFVSVPKWMQRLHHLSFLQITICKIEAEDLKILRDIPQLQFLILGLDFVPRNAIVIESEGFSELLRFSVDCPVPWLTFCTGAMPRLTHLQLEFCSGSANQESVPSGIRNLQRLTEVVLLYNQKWCADSSSVRMTVDAMETQVVKHCNMIDLIINDTKVHAEMKSTTEIQSIDVGEEIARTTVEMTQGETEVEAECDNNGCTY